VLEALSSRKATAIATKVAALILIQAVDIKRYYYTSADYGDGAAIAHLSDNYAGTS
jgi:hypothetical protein